MSAPTTGPWPDGIPSAEYVAALAGRDVFRAAVDRTAREQDQNYAALIRQERECARLEAAAWFDWHEAHGWPAGDDDYRRRLAVSAGRSSRWEPTVGPRATTIGGGWPSDICTNLPDTPATPGGG